MAEDSEMHYALQRAETLLLQEARHCGQVCAENAALQDALEEAEEQVEGHQGDARRNAYLLEQAQDDIERLEAALDDAQAKVAELEASFNRIHIIPPTHVTTQGTRFGHRPEEETK